MVEFYETMKNNLEYYKMAIYKQQRAEDERIFYDNRRRAQEKQKGWEMIAKAVRHRAAFLMPGNSKGKNTGIWCMGSHSVYTFFCMVPGVRP